MTAQGLVYVGPWDIVPKEVTPNVLDAQYLALHDYRYGGRPIQVLELANRMHPFLVDLCCYLVSQGLAVDRAEGYIGEHPYSIDLYIYSDRPTIRVWLLGRGYVNNNRPYYSLTKAYKVSFRACGTHELMDIIHKAMRYEECSTCYYGGGPYCGMGMVMHAGDCSQRVVV